MGTTWRPYQPDQMLLLPQDLREWVLEGHLAHHVSDLVDALDLSAFYAPYEGDGRRNSPYDPRMMVKVLVHGYATGTFSSRKLARKLEEDIAFRMLPAGNFPQHRTLCEFRRRHEEVTSTQLEDPGCVNLGVSLQMEARTPLRGLQSRDPRPSHRPGRSQPERRSRP